MKAERRAVYFAPPALQLLDLAGVAYAFERASRFGAAYDLVFCSSEKTIRTIGGLNLNALVDYRDIDIQESDTVFIPGFDGPTVLSKSFQARNRRLYVWLREAVDRGATVCSVCSGAYLLAHAGLLDGRDCATHWSCVADLQKRYPKINVLRNRLFVKSGENLYTSAGVTSGIDLALHILADRHGSKLAYQVARRLVVYHRRDGDNDQESIYLKYRNHVDDAVHEAQDWLANHLDEPITIEALADRAHSTPRTLTRNFKRRTGLTIGQYLDELRLERAQTLLQDTHCKVEHVAMECGFSGARQLRNLFHKKLRRSPRRNVASASE